MQPQSGVLIKKELSLQIRVIHKFIQPAFLLHGENQSKLTLMSESLRNDGRVWVPKKKGDNRKPDQIFPKMKEIIISKENILHMVTLSPRDISSRSAKEVCDEGRGVNGGEAVYLDFEDALNRLGKKEIEERYGNLFEMYETITSENPYESAYEDLSCASLYNGRAVGRL